LDDGGLAGDEAMMRGLLAVTALGLALGAGASAGAATDDGFAAFWKTFAAAAGKDDKAALASMTTLSPGLDDNDKPLTFDKVHTALLGPAARKCLAKAKPESEVDENGDTEYGVFCGHTIYSFSKTGGSWSLTGSGPDD
jgi:hypothetical protein